jgi:hypothetical protein
MAAMNELTIGGMIDVGLEFAAVSFNCDASNDGVGWVFQAVGTDAITHLGFRYGTRTGTPPTYRISIQGVSTTTGLPDGTVVGGGTPASATFTPPADTTWNGTWQWIALDNSFVPTADQEYALCIEYSSGTINASNFSSMTTEDGSGLIPGSLPYAMQLAAGTWSKKFAGRPIFGVRTAASRYGQPYTGQYTTAISTQTHRIAVKFKIPTDATNEYTVSEIMFGGLMGSTGKAPVVGVWNAAGTALQSRTFDSDVMRNPAAGSMRSNQLRCGGSAATLSAGTSYYFGVEAASATPGSINITGLQLGNADDRLAYPGGTDWCLATWDGASWTDLTTVYPIAQIHLVSMTQQAGGGGGGGPLIGGRLVL